MHGCYRPRTFKSINQSIPLLLLTFLSVLLLDLLPLLLVLLLLILLPRFLLVLLPLLLLVLLPLLLILLPLLLLVLLPLPWSFDLWCLSYSDVFRFPSAYSNIPARTYNAKERETERRKNIRRLFCSIY